MKIRNKENQIWCLAIIIPENHCIWKGLNSKLKSGPKPICSTNPIDVILLDWFPGIPNPFFVFFPLRIFFRFPSPIFLSESVPVSKPFNLLSTIFPKVNFCLCFLQFFLHFLSLSNFQTTVSLISRPTVFFFLMRTIIKQVKYTIIIVGGWK